MRNIIKSVFMFAAVCFVLSGCTEVQLASHVFKKVAPPPKSQGTFKVGNPYRINGKKYYPQENYDLVETGIASWYGPNFHGKQTANGEIYDMNELTAAHRTLQMPSLVRVTNLENGRSLVVRVNDRGPYSKGRVIDLSKRSAEILGFKNQGTAKVKLQVLKQESLKVAELAKRGQSTNGFELAVNRNEPLPESQTRSVNATMQTPVQTAPQQAPARVQTAAVEPVTSEPLQSVLPGHMKSGNFYPDPIVTEMPVVKTDIFVQAGSFSNKENAMRYAAKLSRHGAVDVYPANIDGKQYFRVRFGPVSDVSAADSLLANLDANGIVNTMIVVD